MIRYLIRFVATGLLAAAAAGPLAALVAPGPLTAVLAKLTPRVTYFVPTSDSLVALTIDDRPDPVATTRILDVLSEHEAKATFFVMGDRVRGNEDLLARIRDEQHEVANHTLHERPSILVPTDELSRELAATHELLADYGQVKWFRPGSGCYTDELLDAVDEQGYQAALGNVFPFDAWIPSSQFHAWYILQHVRPGSIIVLHDAKGRGVRTARTLGAVLPALRARGFPVVTLTELVGA
jgi:peptidoglycan/xylan/chitin deacetylase (PgdA/CDA1 family)